MGEKIDWFEKVVFTPLLRWRLIGYFFSGPIGLILIFNLIYITTEHRNLQRSSFCLLFIYYFNAVKLTVYINQIRTEMRRG